VVEEIRKLPHNGGAIMIDTQLMKGILEGCVLSVIAEHETYGYEILQRLTESGFTELGEGTMYPVLTRLEKNGYIQCRKEKSPLGPIRKYYSVTDAGAKHLKEFCESYKSITESAKKILKMEE
jgi:PadR family transcriptional regulator PadR